MTLELKLLSAIPEKPQPKFHVYYDEWTGQITDITNKPLKGLDNPNMLTEDVTAEKLMMGILNPNKWVVAELADGPVLIRKSDAVRIKQAEEFLSKVPKIHATNECDINTILYLNDYVMEVNISQETMYALTGKRFNHNLNKSANANDSSMDLYIIKHNDPNYLVERLNIDPIELMNNGYMLFDLSHLKNTVGLADVDILTKRIFKSYGLKIKQNYVSIDYHTKNSAKRVHTQIDTPTDDFKMFSITPSTAGWIFKSNFDDPHEFKLYKDLNIYLTSEDPFVLLESVRIPFNSLGWQQEHIIKTKFHPEGLKLLMSEEGRNLTFKFEDLEYVKSGQY